MKFPQKEFKLADDEIVMSPVESARWGFEQAKKQMLAKIKKERAGCALKVSMRAFGEEKQWMNALDWLEGELKVDSASEETDTVEKGGLK